MSALAISFDDVVQAQARIAPVATRTPVLTSTTADAMSGAQLFFKCENFQRVGAFKFRGAYNTIAQFTPAQRAAGVVAYSSGNHAQGIALSARLLGVPAVIVMPEDAAPPKLAATRGYGAEVVLYDRYTGNGEAIAEEWAERHGMTRISPFDHPHVMAGQGTVAKEMIDEVGPLDFLLVPLGGGGLLSGCATAAKAMSPGCRVIGVEPEAGNDGQRSFRTGRIVAIEPPRTIADGAQTRAVGQLTFPVIRERVDDIVTASDAELIAAMKFFAARMKMVVEPTGCLAAAVAFGRQFDLAGKRVGVVLTGGNVDLTRFAGLIGEAA
jgi:threo-3-hydroxy-L-aspartate ammonia-lyase